MTLRALAPLQQLQPQPRVPAFLNKLYTYSPVPLLFLSAHGPSFCTTSLVNDLETDEYVRWSDAGITFIIPHAQFMVFHVPFKTINFDYFVRQLNSSRLFHPVNLLTPTAGLSQSTPFKIRDTAHRKCPEIWEFRQEHFIRNSLDLLTIVRKI
jgi:hypothetical protein